MDSFTEEELLAAIQRILSDPAPGVFVGIGDDAAVVDPGSGHLVMTTDVLVEGVHFSMGGALASPSLGYKAMVVNISDIAAMAASPRYALVSLVLRREASIKWVVELYAGMRQACEEYSVALVGGDLSRGDRTSIAVTVTGVVAPGRAVLRSGANPGDRILVTGTLGAAGGMVALSSARMNSELAAASSGSIKALENAFFRPPARVAEAQILAAAGVTSMMDISDGLSLDLSRLCGASGVGARLNLADVPVAPELNELEKIIGAEPLELALSGGEDFELLATMPAGSVAGAVDALKEQFGVSLTDIGEITAANDLVAVEADGSEHALEPQGWDHFA